MSTSVSKRTAFIKFNQCALTSEILKYEIPAARMTSLPGGSQWLARNNGQPQDPTRLKEEGAGSQQHTSSLLSKYWELGMYYS